MSSQKSWILSNNIPATKSIGNISDRIKTKSPITILLLSPSNYQSLDANSLYKELDAFKSGHR